MNGLTEEDLFDSESHSARQYDLAAQDHEYTMGQPLDEHFYMIPLEEYNTTPAEHASFNEVLNSIPPTHVLAQPPHSVLAGFSPYAQALVSSGESVHRENSPSLMPATHLVPSTVSTSSSEPENPIPLWWQEGYDSLGDYEYDCCPCQAREMRCESCEGFERQTRILLGWHPDGRDDPQFGTLPTIDSGISLDEFMEEGNQDSEEGGGRTQTQEMTGATEFGYMGDETVVLFTTLQ